MTSSCRNHPLTWIPNTKQYFELINWSTMHTTQPNNKAAQFKATVHYDDVIMGAMASQITSLTVDSIVYSSTDQRKHQWVPGPRQGGPTSAPPTWGWYQFRLSANGWKMNQFQFQTAPAGEWVHWLTNWSTTHPNPTPPHNPTHWHACYAELGGIHGNLVSTDILVWSFYTLGHWEQVSQFCILKVAHTGLLNSNVCV